MAPEKQQTGTSGSGDLIDYPQTVAEFINRYLFLPEHSAVYHRMFLERMKPFAIRRKQVLLILSALLVGGFWIEDFLTGKSYELIIAYAKWRPTAVASVLLGAAGLRYSKVLREYHDLFYLTIVTACMALGGYLFGSVKGTDFTGFYYMAYMAPMYTIVLCVGLVRRFVAAAITSAGFLTPYFLVTSATVPGEFYLHYFPYWVPVITINTVIGHAIYQYDYRMFLTERELKRQRQEVEHLAKHDQLTGLLNRTHFTPVAEKTFEQSVRYERELSLLMIDIDHFKNINDTYGHLAGDRVLEAIGEVIDDDKRTADVACRFGGEEFCVLAPDTGVEGAEELARRIKQRFQSITFETKNNLSFSVTCSIGISERNDAMNSLQDLIRDADARLYEAKNGGRDLIVTAKPGG